MSTASDISPQAYRRAQEDVGFFAELLLGATLWSHQLEVARSRARYRVICAGRQVGKSRMLAVLAIHDAMRAPGRLVLVVSNGEVAAKRLLSDCAALAQSSPLVRTSVTDEQASVLTLDNGSSIRSVPASQAQIRGWSVDLLIVDEAGFIHPDIWRSAEPAIIARPGSRVILCSSPWGNPDHFFRRLWTLGTQSPSEQVEAWHWPSSISPMVDQALLDDIKHRETPLYFQREYLAEWTDQSAAFFTPEEIDGNVASYELMTAPRSKGQLVAVGVDWGVVHDASTMVSVGVLSFGRSPLSPNEPVFFVASAEERFGTGLNAWARHIAAQCDVRAGGFDAYRIAAEVNGVGTGAVETLRDAAKEAGMRKWHVDPVWTDNRRKLSCYGVMKSLLQQGRLVLPADTALRRQLASVEMHVSDSGNAKIEVPSSVAHDDLADGLMQAIGCVQHAGVEMPGDAFHHEAGPGDGEFLETEHGVELRQQPRCVSYRWAFRSPKGSDGMDVGW